MGVDTSWYLRINAFARETPWLHGPLAAYALWGGLVALAALLVGCWWIERRRADGDPRTMAAIALTGASTIVAVLLNQQVLSPTIARVRPCHALAHVEVLLTCGHDYSMPSDHSIIAGAFVAGLWLVNRAACSVATALAVLLAFGRVYAGVHYPLDTLVGLGAGAVIALVLVLTLRRPVARLAAAVAGSPLRLVVLASGRRYAAEAPHRD